MSIFNRTAYGLTMMICALVALFNTNSFSIEFICSNQTFHLLTDQNHYKIFYSSKKKTVSRGLESTKCDDAALHTGA